MTPEAIRSLVATWAATKPSIRAVWLIGSRAKGTPRLDSDVDVAIATILPTEYGEEWWLREDWQEELEVLIPLPVHLLNLRRAKVKVWAGAREARFLLYWRAARGILGAPPTRP